MDSRSALRIGLDMAEFVGLGYLGDLTESELFHRPAAGANPINWQLGHLIKSEHEIVNGCIPGAMPALPVGFAERYNASTAGNDDPSQFCSKEELLAAYRTQRAATLAALASLSDADLDRTTPEPYHSYASTYAAAFSLQGSHWLMHGGQWAVIRRQLGRPPLY